MNRTLYLIPPIVNETTDLEEASGEYDIFQEKCSPLEQFYFGKEGAIASSLTLTPREKDKGEYWACAQLVHIHATRDHLVLTDPSILNISSSEEAALKESIQYLLEELTSTEVLSINNHWVFPAGEFKSLNTHSPEQAIGRNIDIWLPKDTSEQGIAKKWRKIQNEIQMIWHDHPVNIDRMARGELPINSIWLYGIGVASEIEPHPIFKKIRHVQSSKALVERLMNKLNINFSPINNQELTLENDFLVDCHDFNPKLDNQWESIWQACLQALHTNTVDKLTLLKPTGMTLLKIDLTRDDLKPSLIQKLFFRKNIKNIQYPNYLSIIEQPKNWKVLP